MKSKMLDVWLLPDVVFQGDREPRRRSQFGEGNNYFLFLLAAPHGLQDPCSPTRVEPVPPAMEGRSPNHWMVREFPGNDYFHVSQA